jgi:hypothetical protein
MPAVLVLATQTAVVLPALAVGFLVYMPRPLCKTPCLSTTTVPQFRHVIHVATQCDEM